MNPGTSAARLARTLSDPLRLTILQRLLEGPATVTSLVVAMDEAQSKVSNHLAVLQDGRLVTSERSGRQRIYRVADPGVAQLVETLFAVGGAPSSAARPAGKLMIARTCYDHLAGRLGVAIFDALVERGVLLPPRGGAEDLGVEAGHAHWLEALGVDAGARVRKRRMAYACLDWTERRPHLGGALGAQLCRAFFDHGWITKDMSSRAVFLTPGGRRALRRRFGIGPLEPADVRH